MGWSKDHGTVAKRNADYAKQQGDRAEVVIENTQNVIENAENAIQETNEATKLAKVQADYIAARQSNIEKAIADSGTAITTANAAKSKAESVESQFNRVVADAGGNNPEVVQARGNELNLNARLDKFTTQLSDTARQTSVLSQGVSAVNANNTALADAEIEGRTLVNLLGRLGRTATFATVTVEPTKYYVFVKHNQTTKAVAFDKYTGQTTLSLTWATGEYAALYEVESANYTKIGVEWDSVVVGLRYPYVDDVKHLQGVCVVAEGENLLPPFTEGRVTNVSGNLSPPKSLSLYEVTVNENTNGVGVESPLIPVAINQNYIFSVMFETKSGGVSNRINILSYDDNGRLLEESGLISNVTYNTTYKGALTGNLQDGLNVIQFKITSNKVKYVSLKPLKYDTHISKELSISNPMLTLGSLPKPFVPRNPSYLYVDAKLGAIGNQKDILFKRDDRWLLRKVVNTEVEFPVLLNTPQTTDVTDKVEGQLKLNGLTQVNVDTGYRRTVFDGKSTWTKGSTFDYTANPTAVKLTYANNIRNALDDTTRTVQDNTSMLSVHEKAIVDLYVRVKALEAK